MWIYDFTGITVDLDSAWVRLPCAWHQSWAFLQLPVVKTSSHAFLWSYKFWSHCDGNKQSSSILGLFWTQPFKFLYQVFWNWWHQSPDRVWPGQSIQSTLCLHTESATNNCLDYTLQDENIRIPEFNLPRLGLELSHSWN